MIDYIKYGLIFLILNFMPLVMVILLMNIARWDGNNPLVYWHALATIILVIAVYYFGKHGDEII